MKKMLLLLALLCLLVVPAAAQQPFQIDQINRYDRMPRPYGQGYEPYIADGMLHITLPLLSALAQGDVTAQLVPADAALMPIRAGERLTVTAPRRAITLAGQETGLFRLSYRLPLYPDRLNGEYPYTIQVKGIGAEGKALTQSFAFLLKVKDGVKNPEPPLPLIDSLTAENPLHVGEEGSLNIKLRNGSATRMLERLSLQLSDPAGDIMPKGSDSYDVQPLLPGESAELTIPVTVLHKATAQPHSLTVKLSAALADEQPITITRQFSLPVEQQVRLRLGQPQLAPKAMQGENLAFQLNFMNMGKGKLNNLLMTFDLPGFQGGGSVLVGNLEPGESKLGQSNLRAGQDMGEKQGKLLIEYEDSYGRPYSTELPLQSTVVERPALTTPETKQEKEEEAQKTAPREYIAWGLSGLLLLLLIAYALWSRRKIRLLEEKNL